MRGPLSKGRNLKERKKSRRLFESFRYIFVQRDVHREKRRSNFARKAAASLGKAWNRNGMRPDRDVDKLPRGRRRGASGSSSDGATPGCMTVGRRTEEETSLEEPLAHRACACSETRPLARAGALRRPDASHTRSRQSSTDVERQNRGLLRQQPCAVIGLLSCSTIQQFDCSCKGSSSSVSFNGERRDRGSSAKQWSQCSVSTRGHRVDKLPPSPPRRSRITCSSLRKVFTNRPYIEQNSTRRRTFRRW